MPDNPESTNEMDTLLGWLDNDRDRAVESLIRLRQRLVFYFRFFVDPDTLADEVIDRILNNLRDNKAQTTGKAENYALAVARKVKLEQGRKRKIYSIDDETDLNAFERHKFLAVPPPDEIKDDFEKLLQTTMNCIRDLGHDGETFLKYYSEQKDANANGFREGLAATEGMTLLNLRVKIYRIRKRIIDCVEKKLNK